MSACPMIPPRGQPSQGDAHAPRRAATRRGAQRRAASLHNGGLMSTNPCEGCVIRASTLRRPAAYASRVLTMLSACPMISPDASLRNGIGAFQPCEGSPGKWLAPERPMSAGPMISPDASLRKGIGGLFAREGWTAPDRKAAEGHIGAPGRVVMEAERHGRRRQVADWQQAQGSHGEGAAGEIA